MLHGEDIEKMVMYGKQCILGRVEFGIGRLKWVEQRVGNGREGAF